MLDNIKKQIVDINKDIDRLNLLKKEYMEYSKESGEVAGPFLMILNIGKEIKFLNDSKEALIQYANRLLYNEAASLQELAANNIRCFRKGLSIETINKIYKYYKTKGLELPSDLVFREITPIKLFEVK